MVTKELITKFYDDVEELGLKFPVAVIAKQTGFSKGNVSDYLNKKKEPSENFLKAFYKAFPGSKKVPQETMPEDVVGLLKVMYEQMRTQNRILEGTTIKKIDSMEKTVESNSGNIKQILAGVSSLVIQVQSAREVVLGSLERIENQKAGYLSDQVGKTVRRNMKGGEKQGKKVGIGR